MRGAAAALFVIAVLAAPPQTAAATGPDAYCKAFDAYFKLVEWRRREDVYWAMFFPDAVACTVGSRSREALCKQISQGGPEFPDSFPRTLRDCLAEQGVDVRVETSDRWPFSKDRIVGLRATLPGGARVVVTYEPDESPGEDGYFGRYRMTVTPRGSSRWRASDD